MTPRTVDDRRAARLALLAVAYSVAGASALALLPTATSSSTTSSAGGAVETTTQDSLLHNEGISVLAVLAVPTVLGLVAVLVRRRPVRMTMAVLLFAGCLLGAMSVGLFFVPAALLLLCAASMTSRPVA